MGTRSIEERFKMEDYIGTADMCFQGPVAYETKVI